MKFNDAINSVFRKSLKRIRIKVDPMHASSENYRNLDSYTGYILEESDESLRVMIDKTGFPIIDIPKVVMLKPTMFDLFKMFVEERALMLNPEQVSIVPVKSKSFEDLERQLSSDGMTNKQILNLYRDFLKTYEKCDQI